MRWLDRQLADLRDRRDAPIIVLDPDSLLDDATAATVGEPVEVRDFLALRTAWAKIREASSSSRAVLILRSTEFAEPRLLPWDIERGARIAVVRWPVPPQWRSVAREFPGHLFDLLVDLVDRDARTEAVVTGLLREGFCVVLPAPGAAAELDALARLITSHLVPVSLWEIIQPYVRGPLALALCQKTPNLAPLQEAWADWLSRGDDAAYAATLQDASGAILTLLAVGILRPERLSAAGLPSWSRIGATERDPIERVEELLGSLPAPWPPQAADDWLAVAAWWGDVRAAAAAASPLPKELEHRTDDLWAEVDGWFLSWLRSEYALIFSSSRPFPITLDKVASFLARRHKGTGRRQLLLLLDGMGFAQWSQLRTALHVDVVDAAGCFALCPTLTSVSRQAVFAGAPPSTFSESLWTTGREEARWRAFWANEGLTDHAVGYVYTPGWTAEDVPDLGRAEVHGVVVGAIDDLLHASDLLGDAQLYAGIGTWFRYGFLDSIIQQAHGAGFDVWLTADHGNIEAVPSGRVMEGPLVDAAGTRVRLYENAILRENARAEGLAWNPPGLPPGKMPLFASGRSGYHSGGRKVSHGGLSIDEVIVPFVRVLPR